MAPPVAPPAPGSDIVAAGAVVFRPRNGGEVLLVHRPKYDDWSWPKGKRDPGEHVTATAAREVAEETGLRIRLGRPLPPQRYLVASGRTKQVHYWLGRVLGDDDVSRFKPNSEIDDVAWVPLDKAHRALTYADDIALLERAAKRAKRTSALVVVRHARARKRATWKGPDGERPLTDVGRAQAKALAPALAAYGIDRLVSSDAARCLRTLTPYATAHQVPVEPVPGLNEESASPDSVRRVVEELLAGKDNAVLCSHRPVLPDVFAALGLDADPLSPGEIVVCHHRKQKIIATERHLVR